MSKTPRATDHGALPFADWPQPDREAWNAAVRPADFLEEAGRGSTWRPESQRSARGAYARWLGWLTQAGTCLSDEAPAARITPERIRDYIDFLARGRSTVTSASYFGVLCMVVQAIFR